MDLFRLGRCIGLGVFGRETTIIIEPVAIHSSTVNFVRDTHLSIAADLRGADLCRRVFMAQPSFGS